ncbi:hypothetical protein H8A99_14820 [Bradyrhizobium sp. Arg68]|uniref:hypothetical protein n=1 Tax=Bradyrhizobium ivorense TaxID=2511166 RepID=UPI001E605647|nr:hypothetical protein [Bradyrhizobium ivorense]MCC8937709.1 hypothetical protein [Bradyrhizobium ivorense]
MATLTLKQITDGLRISRVRVEQWISRGFFRTPDQPILGLAREWDIGDAMRLALCVELVDAHMSPQQAGALVWVGVHGFKDDTAFFVAWQGAHEMAGIKGKGGKPAKAHLPGNWYPEIVRGRDLQNFLENSDVDFALVFNLDNLEKRVKVALGRETG